MNIKLVISQYTMWYIDKYLIKKKETVMKYSKPKVVAQNKTEGSYAAGCPANSYGGPSRCKECDRAQ